MPLAFTQEDFLVLFALTNTLIVTLQEDSYHFIGWKISQISNFLSFDFNFTATIARERYDNVNVFQISSMNFYSVDSGKIVTFDLNGL